MATQGLPRHRYDRPRRELTSGVTPTLDTFQTDGPGLPDSDSATFVTTMAHALGTYGTPAHRLEDALETVSKRLGIEGQFFAMPTAVFAALRVPPGKPQTSLIRVHPGEVHLERLVELDEILVDVADAKIGPDEGVRRIEAAIATPDRYGPVMTVLCLGVASACAGRFFGGGIGEITGAGIAGLFIGLLGLFAARRRDLARLIDFLCGLIISFGAISASRTIAPISPEILTIAGLVVFFPGLTLTMAVNELATRNLVAGTARLMSALTVLVSIGFGVALGTKLADMTLPTAEPINPVAQLPGWTLYVAILISGVALSVLFRARPKDIPAIVLSGLIAFFGASYGRAELGPELGACIGAAAMGLYANIYSRVARRPAAVPAMVGVMLLVPGSLSFKSMSSFLAHDAVGGLETAFTTVLIAMSLAVGFLLSNVAVPPRRAL